MAKRLHIYLDDKEFNFVKMIAEKENRTVSNYIQTLIIMDKNKLKKESNFCSCGQVKHIGNDQCINCLDRTDEY